ncbi:hypothetical protein [Streptomyces milbemycinicus]|uniref:Transcription regulator PadR C-terminal domain-containing protein n=1 Tax=Streptomyces milbemycinicus TaxID=476552 RepID=A0ABW8LPM0_9ACTN
MKESRAASAQTSKLSWCSSATRPTPPAREVSHRRQVGGGSAVDRQAAHRAAEPACPSAKPRRNTRSDILLRVFFLGVLEPEQARAYLTGLVEMSERGHEELRRLEESIDWGDDDLSVYGRIALEYGLRFNAMRRE